MSKRYPGGIIRKTPQTPSQTSAQGVWDMTSVTQAVKENTWPIAGVPDPISKSLRFRSSASAYLNRTPASAGNRKTWTWSGWVKRGAIADGVLFSVGTSGSSYMNLRLQDNGGVQEFSIVSENPSTEITLRTSQQFRDPSAWYHFVFALDTTQATSSNRAKLYVNGVQVTAFSSATYPSLNADLLINNNQAHNIGRRASGSDVYFDGYMTEVYFIDGQALTPSSFGTTDDQTGVWEPIAYTGTYGTNGFYLPFSNTTSTTTLGYDFSGNSNNWTPNNISLTSGSTYDSMVDVPTQWIPYNTAGDTGALWRGNYCTLNPIDTYDNAPTQGNLARIGVGHSGSPWSTCRATLGVSTGKWYFEATLTGSSGSYQANSMVGIITTTTSTLSDAYGGSTTRSYQANGGLQGDNSTGSVSSAVSGDVIMCAFDIDAGKVWFGKNGSWFNSGVPASGTGNVFTSVPTTPIAPQVSMYGNTGDNNGWFMNFGQRPFAYTPPSGFLTLNTRNLPTPTIGATASTQANDYFDINLWTGNGGTQAIVNSGSMQPDFVWIKGRNQAYFHCLQDVLRGVSGTLFSNSTAAEETNQPRLSSFNSNGFTLTSKNDANNSGDTYVGWQWKANGTGVTNTAGSITSTVSANTTAGFSIVTYTGNGTASSTVGHGLGVTPNMVIAKVRSTTESWPVFHSSLLSLGTGYFLELDSTTSASNGNSRYPAAPSSSVVTIGSAGNLTPINASGQTYVMYCFAAVAGYSAFGSYTGNGSNDGTFVYLGFRARYVMIKSSSDIGGWVLLDTARDPYNDVDNYLYANSSAADAGSSNVLDINANGFKIRNSWTDINGSGRTYIYMAFAESPFKYALAR